MAGPDRTPHPPEGIEPLDLARVARSQFLANMSHELRTPIHGILSFAEFGMREYQTSPRAELGEYFQQIHESGSVLLGLLDELLDHAKLEAGRMAFTMGPVDLGSLTLDFTSEFEARFADREVTLAIEEPPIGAPVEIEADAHRIAQALRHVLTHAMSAARRSVTVRIEEERSGGVAVVIRDDRPGIPPGELGQLFDPLAQSRRPGNRPGTGLGLPIAREIVSAHHGTITVESTDEATTFYVRLPRRQPGARQDGSAPRENAA